MFALAHELALQGKKVITGTTTKIFVPGPEDTQKLLLTESLADCGNDIKHALKTFNHITLGKSLDFKSNKIEGCNPSVFNELYHNGLADYEIVEADGARGKSIKAPRSFEPVIPEETTVAVAVVGLDVLGKTLDSETVFQPDLFSSVTGLSHGQVISITALFNLAAHTRGLFKGIPRKARRVIFLNKVDALVPHISMQQILNSLSGLPYRFRLVWGRLLPESSLESLEIT